MCWLWGYGGSLLLHCTVAYDFPWNGICCVKAPKRLRMDNMWEEQDPNM